MGGGRGGGARVMAFLSRSYICSFGFFRLSWIYSPGPGFRLASLLSSFSRSLTTFRSAHLTSSYLCSTTFDYQCGRSLSSCSPDTHSSFPTMHASVPYPRYPVIASSLHPSSIPAPSPSSRLRNSSPSTVG